MSYKMKFKSIRSKIIFYSTFCLLLSGAAIIGFATLSVHNTAILKAHDQLSFVAQDTANHVQMELNRAMTSINTLAIILNKVKDSLNPIILEREEVSFLLQSVIKTNKNIAGAFTCWSPNSFDNNDKFYVNEPGHDETGRFAPYWYRNKNGIFEVEPLQHGEITSAQDFHHIHRDIRQVVISDPHIRNIGGQAFSVISLIMPIGSGEKYQGFVGIDLCCHSMAYLLRNPGIEGKNGQRLIVNTNQKILGITGRPDLLCKDIAEMPGSFAMDIKKMAELKPFEVSIQNKLRFYAPVTFVNSNPLWVIVSLSKDEIALEAAVLSKNLILAGIVCILVTIFFLWFLSAHIVQSLDLLIKSTDSIGQGNYGLRIENIKTQDEIGKLASTLNIMSSEIAKKELEKDNIIKDLHEAEEKYRIMMESMDDPVSICTRDYRIEYMNPAMIKRTGPDAKGEPCHKVIHGLDEKCPWCVFEKINMGESINCEIVSPKDDKTFHISNSPVVHTDGSISKLAIFRDITKFKKMATHLQQVQKMESIGTLAGGIAHDFNNILFPIVGHAEMLLEDVPEDSLTRDSLNQIYTSALRARNLVKQILTFSRQESSELMRMRMQPVVKEALKLIRSTIPTTIEIIQDINSDCGVIKADPTQIHQIVMNLATNAYHAMEETGGELKVRLKEIELGEYDVLRPDMKPGVYACLTITDTGTGMDKVITEKIFNPFFTTKKKGKGTGMGLSVVHGIVTNLNGTIQVYSEPGEGTQFHVYLPVEKNLAEEQVTHSKTQIQGGTEQILLVDDEEAILTMEKRMLERLGYQVTSRTSSLEALEAFRANPDKFDLIITDMAMPNMPGDRLSAELIKIRSDIPILLCTGFSETMSEEKAVSLGIMGFLWKPIVMKDLAHRIREVLDEK